jgi:antitoxin component of MazEF toxin-antitoxin module
LVVVYYYYPTSSFLLTKNRYLDVPTLVRTKKLVSVVRRKILKEGGSRTVALPPHWLNALGLDRGDVVEVVYNDLVLVMPIDFSVDPDSLRRELEWIMRIRKSKPESLQVVVAS